MNEELKNWRNYSLLIVAMVCITALGCPQIVNRVTPADVPEQALDYLSFEPNDVHTVFGMSSLYEVRILAAKVEILHREEQLRLTRALTDDTYDYETAKEFLDNSIFSAEAVQDVLIGSPEQPMSLLGLLGGGALGTFAGKLMRRRGDVPRKDVQQKEENARAAGRLAGIEEGRKTT